GERIFFGDLFEEKIGEGRGGLANDKAGMLSFFEQGDGVAELTKDHAHDGTAKARAENDEIEMSLTHGKRRNGFQVRRIERGSSARFVRTGRRSIGRNG